MENSADGVEEGEDGGGFFAFAPCGVDFNLGFGLVESNRGELEAGDGAIHDGSRADEDRFPRGNHYRTGFLMSLDVGNRESWRETMPAVQADDLIVEAGGEISIEQDEWFAGHVSQLEPPALGEAVRPRQDDDEFLLEQQLAVEIDLIDRRTQKANVDDTFEQRLVLLAGENVFAFDIDSGAALAMLEHGFADDAAETRSDADPNDPGFTFLCVTSGFAGVTCLHD